jgi:flagellar hook protein FlgE
MERSLAAAVSGINAEQTYLDAIGNNIANSSTDGYKQENVLFSDLLTQQVNGATAPVPPGTGTAVTGGINPIDVGSGTQVVGVVADQSEGPLKQTGLASNAAIEGNGYFVVSQNGQQLYTRAGDFTLDAKGELVTPSGGLVQGWSGTTTTGATAPVVVQLGSYKAGATSGPTLQAYSIGANGQVTGTYSDGSTAVLATIALATFPNPNGLSDLGNSYYSASPNSGTATVAPPGTGPAGTLQGGAIEGSNVNLAQQLTDLVSAQTNYEADTKVVGTTSQVLQALVQMP